MLNSDFKPTIQLWLELETRCNLKCRFCYNYWKDGSAAEPPVRSTDDTLAALASILGKTKCEYVAFSGGEPLLRQDLARLISFVTSLGIPAILTTNGILLTTSKIKMLMEAGIETFQIPLHSHNASVHDYLSGSSCWKQSMMAIMNVQFCGGHAVVVFVGTRSNLGDLPKVVRIAGELGLEKLIFNRFIPTGLGATNKNTIGVPSESELLRALQEADSVAARYKIEIHLGVPVEVPPEVSRLWSRVILASCPVRVGQQRWTLGSDLVLRRCNHSPMGSSSIDEIVRERISEAAVDPQPDVIRPCQFLRTDRYVQIRVAGNM